MAASLSKSNVIKLDRRGEHRDDVADVRTPTSAEGKFVFVPTVRTAERGKNDDHDIYSTDETRPMLSPAIRFKRSKATSSGSNLPRPLNVVPSLNHTYRFLSIGSALAPIYVGTLLGAAGGIGTVANTTIKSFGSSVKLNSVRIWPPVGSNAFVEWSTSEGYSKDEVKDESIPSGITVSKCLTFRPPKASLASFWQNTSSNILFQMFAPSGSIIDVNMSFTLSGAFPSVANTAAAVTVGNVYYLYLDGSTSKQFQPVGLPTTV